MKKNRYLFAMVAVLGSLALPWVARADDPTPSPQEFNDPAIHYTAPDGWTRKDLPGGAPNSDGPQLLAMFAKTFGRYDQRTITLSVEPYEGSLDAARGKEETELRNGGGGDGNSVFFDRKDHITLSNGMPAWYLKVSTGEGAGSMARLYQYVIIDGKRMIIATYAGRDGYFNDKDALDALSSLTVVLYPRGR